MEHAKDDVFDVRYNEEENVIEVGKNGKNKLGRFLRQNPVFSGIVVLTIMIGLVNTILISNFITLLSCI